MSKRVLIFSTAYLPFIGGAELAVKEITDRLPDYDFDLITARIKSSLPKNEVVGRVNVYRLGWGVPILDKLYLAFRGGAFGQKLGRQKKYDLVWGIMASFGGLAAAKFKQQTGVPFILTLQEGDNLAEVESKMAPLWWQFKNIFSSADWVQTISTYLADWAIKMGADKNKITVVPNGVDLKTFFCDQFSCDQEKINTTDQKVIFTSSRLVKKNAVEVIIKALTKVPSNFILKIAGTGPEEENLKLLVKELNLTREVEFLGNLSHQEIAQELKQADIFARPSRSEGLGNSFLEAMAAGVPVVATTVGGITDFLKHQETGFVCEVDNPESLAEQIKFIVDPQNKEKVWIVTNNARNIVKEKYHWEKISLQIGEIFASLIG
jgi:glycosyltransferase involved in cell wall biosynthesis